MLGGALDAIRWRLRRLLPQSIDIGRYRLRLPSGSRLPEYKARFRLHNVAIGTIANALHSKYPDLHAIDIGANVADTAAAIRQSFDIPVLCIEGDSTIQPTLQGNAGVMGRGVLIEPSFVGLDGVSVNLGKVTALGRNASLRGAVGGGGSVRLRSLRQILERHPAFENAKLLKTDTEGFDFDILRQSLEFIAGARPIIFFEYDPSFTPSEPDAGLDTIKALIGIGYKHFVYYDNFGNRLLSVSATHQRTFRRLHTYLASNRRHGTAIYYFDICALHRDDAELTDLIADGAAGVPS
jgi:FkbM family methyltransferase